MKSLIGRVGGLIHNNGDRLNSIRRNTEMIVDQAVVRVAHRIAPPRNAVPFDGQVRFALLTVNFSTTRYLKLMLLTLIEQEELTRLSRIVIVDNDSRDGGRRFLRRLSAQVDKVALVENDFFPSHARGMRLGVDWLRRNDTGDPMNERSNVLLFCDTDVVFRRSDTLRAVAARFSENGAGFVGELRHGIYPIPEAQASFIAVRRDIYDRPDVTPMVHHGAPAYPMQESLHQNGVEVSDFPSNFGGYILHRGRTGVAATRTYRPFDAHATARTHNPHFMGVPGGAAIFEAFERKYSHLLSPESEAQLIAQLRERLGSENTTGRFDGASTTRARSCPSPRE